ncbi:MAG TPA: UvrD-helicase domain-containing protein [Kineosporiaceae bacterium]
MASPRHPCGPGGTGGSPATARRASLSTSSLQQELDTEQSYVTMLYTQLDTLRERAARALEEVRRAPLVPTPAGRAERDAFDAWHSERVERLAAVEDRLAFGRLDLADGERRYVGRLGLSDDSQRQLLLDWRAPAAASFYQATAATPRGVARRRHIATRGRQVTSIDDELLDADALDAAGLAVVAGEGALMSALTAHRTGRMRDIVATLQAEQDRIVRAPLAGVLVVQGGPGTGKTAVALHRAAYLLYTHRDRIARSGVLVVGPSAVFLRYIEQVLPSLGETGVVMVTPGQLFAGAEATDVDPPAVALVKGDLRMAEVLRRAVRARQRLLRDPVPVVVDGDEIVLRPRVVGDARARARQTGKPHNEARNTFVKHLLDDLSAQLAKARGLDAVEEKPELYAELRDHPTIRREINLLWLPLTATGLLGRLYDRPDRLAEAADGVLNTAERAALRRAQGSGWTVADVPLLDELAELIGPDVTVSAAARAAAARASAERAEALQFARTVLESSGEAAAMMTPEMLADRFAGGGPARSVAERARDDRTWTFGHAVVDEAQELSPMQWRLLVRRVPSRSMTVVGDVAQTGSAAGTTSWARVLDVHAPDRWRLEELTVNYRTPAVVMEPAVALLAAAGLPVKAPQSAREGDWAPTAVGVPAGDDQALVDAVQQALRADEAALRGGRFVVVTPRGRHAALAAAVGDRLTGSELAQRTEVMTVDDVKGLEFDTVILVDPGRVVRESRRGVNDLYVAMTRPTQRLTVLHHDDLPPGLESLLPA